MPILCILYVLSEAGLLWLKRSGKTAADADRGSLALLWVVILVSVFAAFTLAHALPQLILGAGRRLPGRRRGGVRGRHHCCAGTPYSSLGRFFTVNVAIAADHQLVEAGPYWLRAPPVVHGRAARVSRTGTMPR